MDPYAVDLEACRGRQRRLLEVVEPLEVDFFENTKPNENSDDDWGHRLTLDPPGRYASARVTSLNSRTPASYPAGAVDLSDSTPDMHWDDEISSFKWDP